MERSTEWGSVRSRFLGSTAILLLALSTWVGAEDRPTTPDVPVTTLAPVKGVWVLTSEGKTVPAESFRRGLQTSGLFHGQGLLWSVGDQRSQYPGHLLLVDPSTGRLVGRPIRLEAPDDDSDSLVAAYRALSNSDLEGLTRHPSKIDTLYAVTEDKHQWVIEIRLDAPAGVSIASARETVREARAARIRARLVRISKLEFPENVRPFRDDTNSRLEGVTFFPGENALLLAYERLDDELPRLFRVGFESDGGVQRRPSLVPIDFSKVSRRSDKSRARLNINGVVAFERAGRKWVIAVARDQERLLIIDLEARRVVRALDLELRSPEGKRMLWVSPEGVAADPGVGKVWVINDPDSIRGNYRLLKDEKATGKFAEYAPQLFGFEMAKVLD